MRCCGNQQTFKDRLEIQANKWRREKYRSIIRGERLPSPKRVDLLQWLSKIWEEFPPEIVHNAFSGSMFCYEYGVDYSGETESESGDD